MRQPCRPSHQTDFRHAFATCLPLLFSTIMTPPGTRRAEQQATTPEQLMPTGGATSAARGPAPNVTAAAVSSAYRRYAPVYDTVFGAVLEPGRKALAAAVAEEKPGSLLEIGVGTGLLLPQYPKEVAVTGIDLSAEMLEKARERANQMPDRSIQLLHSNAETLQFDDAAFDCVTIPYVLSVTPEPGRLLAEARRVCRRGGAIMVANHFSGSRAWWLLEKLVSPLAAKIGFSSEFRYDEQIVARGCQVERVQPVNLFGLSKLVVIRN